MSTQESEKVTVTLTFERQHLESIARQYAMLRQEPSLPISTADLRAALQVEAQPSPPIDDDHPILLAIREAVATELEACGYRDEEGEPCFADGCEWIANEISNQVKPLLANQPDPQPSVEQPLLYTKEMVDAAAESMATLDGFSDMHPVSRREGLLLALDHMFQGQPSVEQGVAEERRKAATTFVFRSELKPGDKVIVALEFGTDADSDLRDRECEVLQNDADAFRLRRPDGWLEYVESPPIVTRAEQTYRLATKGTDHAQH